MGRPGNRLILVVLLLGALVLPVQAGASGVRLESRETSAGPTWFVRIPPERLRSSLEVHMAVGGRGDAETFSSFVHRLRPAMAVNGTYFSYSGDRGFSPVLPIYGTGVMEAGETERPGLRGSVLAITTSGAVLTRRLQSLREARSLFETGQYRVVVGVGPTLVQGGRARTSLEEWAREGFSPTGGVLDSGDRPRVGAGVLPTGELLLASSARPVSLELWARGLQELGCVDAINLDGGKSQGFFVQEEGFVQTPTDPLTNVLVLVDEAVRRGPRPDSGVLLEAARAAEAAGDLEVAVERYRELAFHDPGCLPAFLGAAGALEKQGHRASAAAFYARAGLVQAERGETAASRRSLRRALALSPGRVDVATALSGVGGLEAEETEVLEQALVLGTAEALGRLEWGSLEGPFQRDAEARALVLEGQEVPLPAGFRTVLRSRQGRPLAVDAERSAVLTLLPSNGRTEARRVVLSGTEFALVRREVAPGVDAVLALPAEREALARPILEPLVRE